MDATQLETKLKQFYGTENYYRNDFFSRVQITDGVQWLRTEAKCFWLTDAIDSYQASDVKEFAPEYPHLQKVREITFQLWELKVNDGKGVLTMREDSDTPVIIKQEFGYTDFPLSEIKFYLIDGVLMLPSEY